MAPGSLSLPGPPRSGQCSTTICSGSAIVSPPAVTGGVAPGSRCTVALLLAAIEGRPELSVSPAGTATAAASPSDVVICSESDSGCKLVDDCTDMAQRSARIPRHATDDNLCKGMKGVMRQITPIWSRRSWWAEE